MGIHGPLPYFAVVYGFIALAYTIRVGTMYPRDAAWWAFASLMGIAWPVFALNAGWRALNRKRWDDGF